MKREDSMIIKKANSAFLNKYKDQINDLLVYSIKLNLQDIYNANNFANERIKLMKQSLLDNSAIIYYVEEDETLLGFIWAYLKDATVGEIHITDIIVDKNYQSKHIGTVLLNSLENYCTLHNHKIITLLVSSDNIQALNLYKKQNFYEYRKLLRKVVNNDSNI